jgi:hypothetical protein
MHGCLTSLTEPSTLPAYLPCTSVAPQRTGASTQLPLPCLPGRMNQVQPAGLAPAPALGGPEAATQC